MISGLISRQMLPSSGSARQKIEGGRIGQAVRKFTEGHLLDIGNLHFGDCAEKPAQRCAEVTAESSREAFSSARIWSLLTRSGRLKS